MPLQWVDPRDPAIARKNRQFLLALIALMVGIGLVLLIVLFRDTG